MYALAEIDSGGMTRLAQSRPTTHTDQDVSG